MHIFEYFVPFLFSVWDHVFTLLAGCVVTVVINLIERYALNGKKLSVKIDIAILLAFLFFACFQAWQDQYKSATGAASTREQLQKQIDDLNKPILKASVDALMSADLYAGSKNGPQVKRVIVAAVIAIKNSGAPSVVIPEDALITLKDGRKIRPYTVPSTGKNLILPTRGGGITTLKTDDYLTMKAFGSPIPRGGATFGWVEYALPRDVKREDLMDGVITVHLSDVNDNRLTTTDVFKYDNMAMFNPSKDD